MSNDIVVFLGPTLDRAEAEHHLPAIYCPPAEQGSIVEIVKSHSPCAIVVIDGVFAKAPAVRHKEIIWAMSRGYPIFGAASMGALRAAELATCGMIGHGFIYRWYRATPFADDDEVAVAMTPVELGARPLSDALINIRLTLHRAERAGVIARPFRDELIATARSIHFIERTYAHLFERARSLRPGRGVQHILSLESWVRDHAVDQKRADAVAMLRWLADQTRSSIAKPTSPPFVLTEAWASDLAIAGIDVGQLHI